MDYFSDIKKDWVPGSQGDVYYHIAEAPDALGDVPNIDCLTLLEKQ